uniref:BZIP domain-containing protein n=1 Tax=Strongyloides venezuelensis TaxID=75913 RepID=A0A0K0EU88_STRVS
MKRNTVIQNTSKDLSNVNFYSNECKEEINCDSYREDMTSPCFKESDDSVPSSPESISNDRSLKKRGRPRKKDEEEEVIMSQILRKRKYARNYRETQRKRLEQYEFLLKEHERLHKENELLRNQLKKYTEKEKLQELQKLPQFNINSFSSTIPDLSSAALIHQLLYNQQLNLPVSFSMT